MSQPNLNVTPLIDILLVLLIIFMVISPLKPSSFKTKIPAQPNDEKVLPNPYTLVVNLKNDSSLELNNTGELGNIENPQKLTEKLIATFAERKNNNALSENAASQKDSSSSEGIERTVFIKAPKNIDYGKVVKVIDAVKLSGASPIGLQIDDLKTQ